MDKSKFHLGQTVRFDGEDAIIDSLLQSCVGLIVNGGYKVVPWEFLEQD